MTFVKLDLVWDEDPRRKRHRDRRRTTGGVLFFGALAALLLSSPRGPRPPGSVDALVIEPLAIVFGSQQVGLRATQSVSIENGGTTRFVAARIEVDDDSSQFALTSENCGVIPAHGRCDVGIAFRPQSSGSLEAALTIEGKGGDEIHIKLTGIGSSGTPPPTDTTVTATADTTITTTADTTNTATTDTTTTTIGTTTATTETVNTGPAVPLVPKLVISGDFSFGDQRIDTSASRPFTITNEGNAGGTIAAPIRPQTGPFRVDSACVSEMLRPGESCGGRVIFTPSTPDTVKGQLIVTDGTGAISTATLTGRGILHQIVPDKTVVKFAAVGEDKQTITFTNKGNDVAVLGQPVVLGQAVPGRPFSVVPGGCAGRTLQPGESCSVVVLSLRPGGSKGARLVMPDQQGQVTVLLEPNVVAPVNPNLIQRISPNQFRKVDPKTSKPANN